eukprot:4460301-Amphidinium_carterae.1
MSSLDKGLATLFEACTFYVDLSDWHGKEVELWTELPEFLPLPPIDGSVGNLVFVTRHLAAAAFGVGGIATPPSLIGAFVTGLDVREYSSHAELLGVPVYEHCGSWSGVMAEAQRICDGTPGCTVILSPGYTAAGLCDENARWYVCTSSIDELLADVAVDDSS